MVVYAVDVVTIPWDQEIYDRAINRARKKSEWIDTWKKRTQEQRMLDFLDGQLGEEGFRRYLEINHIRFTYYDDIRTDDFKERDLYDFMVFNAETQLEVSVKSSKLKKTIEETVTGNNILAYPSQIKPITVQPFIDYDRNNIVLAGWASREQLESRTPRPLPGKFSDQRVLYHMMKIREANTMAELVTALHQS